MSLWISSILLLIEWNSSALTILLLSIANTTIDSHSSSLSLASLSHLILVSRHPAVPARIHASFLIVHPLLETLSYWTILVSVQITPSIDYPSALDSIVRFGIANRCWLIHHLCTGVQVSVRIYDHKPSHSCRTHSRTTPRSHLVLSHVRGPKPVPMTSQIVSTIHKIIRLYDSNVYSLPIHSIHHSHHSHICLSYYVAIHPTIHYTITKTSRINKISFRILSNYSL